MTGTLLQSGVGTFTPRKRAFPKGLKNIGTVSSMSLTIMEITKILKINDFDEFRSKKIPKKSPAAGKISLSPVTIGNEILCQPVARVCRTQMLIRAPSDVERVPKEYQEVKNIASNALEINRSR